MCVCLLCGVFGVCGVWSVLCVCVIKNSRMNIFNPQELFQLETALYILNEKSYFGACSKTYVSLYADMPIMWRFLVRLRSVKPSLRKPRSLDG